MTVQFSTRCPNSDYLGFETSRLKCPEPAPQHPFASSNPVDWIVCNILGGGSELRDHKGF
jgi:hypothetical protein